MTLLFSLLITGIVIIPFSPWQDTHWPKWWMFHIVASFILGYKFSKKYTLSLGVLVGVSIYSGANIFCNRDSYSGMNQILRIDLSNMAGKAVVAFLVLLMMLEYLDTKTLKSIIRAYIIWCVFHCVYVLVQLYWLHIPRDMATGFLPNVSMGPSMLAILYPFLLFQSAPYRIERLIHRFGVLLFPFLIWIEGSSIAWFSFVVSMAFFIYLVFSLFFKRQAIFWGGSLLALGLSLGSLVDSAWTIPSRVSRFDFWPKIFVFWWEHLNRFYGAGTGAFRHLGPNLQQVIKFDVGSWWYWAHNDWLQILFETGFLGLISAGFLWLRCVKIMYDRKEYHHTVALVAFVIVAFGNYPLRLAEYCLLSGVLLAIPIKTLESKS